MTPRRREDDADDTGVLQRSTAGAWRLLAFIGGILVAAAMAVGAVNVVATDAATKVVQPVEKRLDDHLASGKALREVMDRYVLEERAARRSMARKLDALCRANPRADCPLGDE